MCLVLEKEVNEVIEVCALADLSWVVQKEVCDHGEVAIAAV